MMRARLLALAERRTRLVARAQAERESVARLLAPTDTVASMASAVYRIALRVIHEAKQHPLFAIAGGAVLAAMRPRRAIGWIARGWSLYRLYRNLLPVWQRFAATSGAADRPRHPS